MTFLKDMRSGLSRNVTFLGIVSGLTDISSEMLYPIVPIFLTSVLGAPMAVIGLIEGVAEATASFVKILGGRWSDKAGKRKPFVIAGYSLSAISKPLLALASVWQFVLFSRFIDRLGKGLRTSARDALVSDSTPREHWGKAFGFHRAMDTAGAALGPLAALAILSFMPAAAPNYRLIFLAAFIPAILGVLVLYKFVKETERQNNPETISTQQPINTPMTGDFKIFLGLYAVFALGNSSDIFLIMKAKHAGFTTAHVILAYTGYNIVYALMASPAGWLADKLGKLKTMIFGFLVFAAVYLGFAYTEKPSVIWMLFALYGFYGAFNEGIAKAVVARLSQSENRASAMGNFQGVMGFMTLFASILAGQLWDKISPAAPFILGASGALISALALTFWLQSRSALQEKI